MKPLEIARSLRADPDDAARYRAAGWWSDRTLSARIAELAATRPDAVAWITPEGRCTWRAYDRAATRIAALIAARGLAPGARVAVLLPDGPAVHAVLLGVERAGMVAVGIGARAGVAEVTHLLKRTGATLLIAHARQRDRSLEELVAAVREQGAPLADTLVVPDLIAEPGWCDGPVADHAPFPAGDPDTLFLINSTSGTTGMPKCVMHTQNRWFYFHRLAAEAGRFGDGEVFLGAVPMPFGFGLWTSHFSPAALGCSTVVLPKFDAGTALDMIARERVTVLCCVSTQFIMLLNEQAERPRDLSSLKCMFTGGEAVPYRRAAEFEEVTGAAVLQFYGSNETGALSHTTAADTRDRRLTTAGQVIPEMDVRLFDPATGAEVEGRGQPACKGPATCLGYWDDDEANAKLFTSDGWMLMGDIVEIDAENYLRVVGRTSEFIIRGGKNLSAPAIEAEVATHPAVALVAAVPAPDAVFGERVCIYVAPRPGQTVALEEITAHLAKRGISREWFPEYLVLMEDLPRSSGGKVAKGELAADAKKRWAVPA
ncbi:class I adenylate-forming enzyme family protein [Novosphingobium sp. MD-1]|uniref:class I adenylate-forming enzyme family protein n=1 Tax=Novosphingobium sp. MD-1 TaxID=1630648 RepID=UPI00061C19BF|nr:class I adenylate-forming enzyme family protein [Novosphingobium sp. MD-1]GAO53551.1 long-chain-fatty-acid--CoA ligase [Novosphingobium sp. MD-1]